MIPTPLIERVRLPQGERQNPADFVVGTREVKERLQLLDSWTGHRNPMQRKIELANYANI